jgi:DNA-binding MarR family transcriptional regulator
MNGTAATMTADDTSARAAADRANAATDANHATHATHAADVSGVLAASELGIDAARLRAAVLRLARRLRKHELAGLTPSQLSTLSSVGQCGPIRLGDLAAAERIAPSTLTRLVNVLEERGYLLRQPAPDDARAYLVTVTEAGRDVLERIRAEATSLLTDILLTLPGDQRAALDAALPALEELAGLAPGQPKRVRKAE